LLPILHITYTAECQVLKEVNTIFWDLAVVPSSGEQLSLNSQISFPSVLLTTVKFEPGTSWITKLIC